MTSKNPERIEGLVLQGIYDELLQLHKQVNERALVLHKKNIITVEEAQKIIKRRPEEDNA
jgi:hypothetical protein